ncbi:MAG: hypothetical protein H6577_12975 [Lewinellaceae bacterium]|nr:hypothetical protein [Saprospiraceae bacterium]MCB9339036.1 hypothetical protein [Lewinellaceae bacterium]
MQNPLLNDIFQQFDGAKFYLGNIPETAYCQPLGVLSGSTVGQHTRHFIEFFQCLIEHNDKRANGERHPLNYDGRRRDLSIETNPLYALEIMEKIATQLPFLNGGHFHEIAYKNYQSNITLTLPTSLERELLYNLEHVIHHFALIKIGLKIVAPLLDLPEHFGVAASTIHSRNARAGIRQ